jgi:glycolate oxidase FAD binding subunit
MVRLPTETPETLTNPGQLDETAIAEPSRVSVPADAEELMQVIADCAERGEAVYPQGGRTAWNYGGLPIRSGLTLDTRSLDKVIDYPFEDMTITVEAGMTLGRLQAILAENNQYLPIDPPNAETATLGGIMATGWTGPRRHQALRPRDQLIGVAFVDGMGQLLKGGGRVVKNVAGYDFPKLLSGSMGTLGIISQLTFKVRPRPESTALAWVRLPDADALGQLLDRLNLSATRPTCIEVCNRHRAEEVGLPAGLQSASFVAAIGFDESAKAVDWQCEKIAAELPDTAELDILKDAAALPIWKALTEGHTGLDSAAAVVARVVTRPGRLAAFLGGLDSSAWSVQAHGGQGIAMLKAVDAISVDRARAFAELCETAVSPWGGSVIWPNLPDDWKPGFPIWGRHRPDQDLMAGIKLALDPKRILNPGRFLGLG